MKYNYLPRLGLLIVALVAMLSGVSVLQAAENNIIVVYNSEIEEDPSEFVSDLQGTIERKRDKQHHYLWIIGNQNHSCPKNKRCVLVKVDRYKDHFSIRFFEGNKRKFQTAEIYTKKDESMFDVAQTIAMKILFTIKQYDIKLQRKAPEPKADKKKSEPAVKPVEKPIEKEPESQPEPLPIEPEKETEEPKPAESQEATIKLPEKDKLLKKPKPKPVNRDSALVHLQIKPVFITGFEYEYNTGGLELGVTFRFLKPLAIKLDIGYYPNGRSHTHSVTYTNWSLLPCELSIGYRNSFDNWYVAAYGGIYTMQVWSDQKDNDEEFSDSRFMYGVSATFEGGYNFHKWISLGLFVRPFYLINDYTVYMYDPWPLPEDQGQDSEIPSERYKAFELPKFQMMVGFVININF